MMENNIRAFFAIKPPPLMYNFLESLLKTLIHADQKHFIKWIDVEKLHITLQFIKSIQREDIDLLIELVNSRLKSNTAFQLEFDQLEWFPALYRPRVLSLRVGPQVVLKTLAATLGQALIDLNYPVETRPFRGHLSLGRLAYSRTPVASISRIKLSDSPVVEINEVHLIESQLGKGKTLYLPLAQFKLT